VNHPPPSLFAILIFSGAGFFAGRSFFPKIDPAKQAEKVRAEMQEAYDKRSGLGGAFVSGLRETAAALQQPGADPAKLWAAAAAVRENANLRGAKLAFISAAAGSHPAAVDYVKQHAVESPWNFLHPAAPAGTAAPHHVAATGLNVAALRESYSAAAGPARAKAAENLAAGLARCHPGLAEEWIAGLTDEVEQAAALGGAAGAWAEAEPLRASEWIASLPEGPQRDAAAAGFVRKGAAAHPLLALAWGLQVSARETRLEIMDAALREAGKSAPEAARDRIAAASLDEREKLDYLESLGSHATGAGLAP